VTIADISWKDITSLSHDELHACYFISPLPFPKSLATTFIFTARP